MMKKLVSRNGGNLAVLLVGPGEIQTMSLDDCCDRLIGLGVTCEVAEMVTERISRLVGVNLYGMAIERKREGMFWTFGEFVPPQEGQKITGTGRFLSYHPSKGGHTGFKSDLLAGRVPIPAR